MRIKQAIARLERAAATRWRVAATDDGRARLDAFNDLLNHDPDALALAQEYAERLSGAAFRFGPSPFDGLDTETVSARLSRKVEEHRRLHVLERR